MAKKRKLVKNLRGRVRPLRVRIAEMEENLDRLKLQDKIKELKESVRRKRRR